MLIDKIIQGLQKIPEEKLAEIYDRVQTIRTKISQC